MHPWPWAPALLGPSVPPWAALGAKPLVGDQKVAPEHRRGGPWQPQFWLALFWAHFCLAGPAEPAELAELAEPAEPAELAELAELEVAWGVGSLVVGALVVGALVVGALVVGALVVGALGADDLVADDLVAAWAVGAWAAGSWSVGASAERVLWLVVALEDVLVRLVLVAEPAEPVVGSLVVELLVQLVACLVALWLALLLATVLVGPWGEAVWVAGVWQRLVGVVGAAAIALASLAWGAAQKPSLVPQRAM